METGRSPIGIKIEGAVLPPSVPHGYGAPPPLPLPMGISYPGADYGRMRLGANNFLSDSTQIQIFGAESTGYLPAGFSIGNYIYPLRGNATADRITVHPGGVALSGLILNNVNLGNVFFGPDGLQSQALTVVVDPNDPESARVDFNPAVMAHLARETLGVDVIPTQFGPLNLAVVQEIFERNHVERMSLTYSDAVKLSRGDLSPLGRQLVSTQQAKAEVVNPFLQRLQALPGEVDGFNSGVTMTLGASGWNSPVYGLAYKPTDKYLVWANHTSLYHILQYKAAPGINVEIPTRVDYTRVGGTWKLDPHVSLFGEAGLGQISGRNVRAVFGGKGFSGESRLTIPTRNFSELVPTVRGGAMGHIGNREEGMLTVGAAAQLEIVSPPSGPPTVTPVPAVFAKYQQGDFGASVMWQGGSNQAVNFGLQFGF